MKEGLRNLMCGRASLKHHESPMSSTCSSCCYKLLLYNSNNNNNCGGLGISATEASKHKRLNPPTPLLSSVTAT